MTLSDLGARVGARAGLGPEEGRKGLRRLVEGGKVRLGRRRKYRLENIGNWRVRIRGVPRRGPRRPRLSWQCYERFARDLGLSLAGRPRGTAGDGRAALSAGAPWGAGKSRRFLEALRSVASRDLLSNGSLELPGLGRWRLFARRAHQRRGARGRMRVRAARLLSWRTARGLLG